MDPENDNQESENVEGGEGEQLENEDEHAGEEHEDGGEEHQQEAGIRRHRLRGGDCETERKQAESGTQPQARQEPSQRCRIRPIPPTECPLADHRYGDAAEIRIKG